MTREELVAKIEANPCLARYFENWTTGSRICPCCVKKAISLPDQQQFETLLDAVITKNAEFKEAERKLEEATREPKLMLEEVRGQYSAVERHLLIQLGWSVSDPSDRR